MPSNIIKPFFNARLSKNLQNAAKELQEQQDSLIQEARDKANLQVEKLSESTFSRVKSNSSINREKQIERKKYIQEQLLEFCSSLVYGSLPIDNDVKHSAAGAIHNKVMDKFMSETNIVKTLGDKVTRTGYVSFGNQQSIDNTVCGLLNAKYDGVLATEQAGQRSLKDSGRYSAMDFISTETSYDIPQIRVVNEQLDHLKEQLTELIHKKIILEMKNESEISDKESFLNENLEEDPNFRTKNKHIHRQTAKTTVFREIFKNVKIINENVAVGTEEDFMAEALLEYTILETFNTMNLVNFEPDAYIKKLQSERYSTLTSKV